MGASAVDGHEVTRHGGSSVRLGLLLLLNFTKKFRLRRRRRQQ